MDIEQARYLLAERGLTIVETLEDFEDGSALFLCKRKNGTEIEVSIDNGLVIIAPE